MELVLLVVSVLALGMRATEGWEGELSTNYYAHTCPGMELTVRRVMEQAVQKEPRMAASILRLHFHDCFVHGCDASILLDDDPSKGITSEKTAGANFHSARGFGVIDQIKAAVEKECPGVVSSADILSMAAAQAVNIMRGPSWKMPLGRRDSTSAFPSVAKKELLPPTSDPSQLLQGFQKHGLSAKELVALYGAHTLGKAQCFTFRKRIYTENATIDPKYARAVQRRCPSAQGSGDSNLLALDFGSEKSFDNTYFRNLMAKRGLLHSDQALLNGGDHTLASLVEFYAYDQKAFFRDFADSMISMSSISPLTYPNGQVRRNCRRLN